MEISVVFQGGGAKVFELIAAAKALREKESRDVKFCRSSGSSAGAIAATMLAINCDIDAIVSQQERLQRLVASNFPASRMKPRNFAYRLWRGRPIFDERSLENAIRGLFELGGVDATKPIRDLVRPGMQLRIARSNVRHKTALWADQTSDIALWEALADSAAIPFAFRMPSSSNTPEILDGGLFQNLPAKAAIDGLRPDQVPLGVSFTKQASKDLRDVGVKDYASTIIGSLIDERVEESIEQLRRSHIITIPNERGTFDFESIFDEQFSDRFRKSQNQVSVAFDDWKGSVSALKGPDWHSDHPEDLREHIRKNDSLVMDFFARVRPDSLHLEKITHDVVFNSWDHRSPDIVTMKMEVSGDKNEGIQHFRFWFYDSNEGSLGAAKIEVLNSNSELIPALVLPIRNTGIDRSRSIVVALQHPLRKGETIIIKKTEETFSSFRDYISEGITFQTLALGAGRTAEKMEMCVHFPDSHRPHFFRDATPDVPREKIDYDKDEGLQISTSPTSRTDLRTGCVSIETETALPSHSDASKRRYVKLVFSRQS